jgi:hypothetical protein
MQEHRAEFGRVCPHNASSTPAIQMRLRPRSNGSEQFRNTWIPDRAMRLHNLPVIPMVVVPSMATTGMLTWAKTSAQGSARRFPRVPFDSPKGWETKSPVRTSNLIKDCASCGKSRKLWPVGTENARR